MAILSAQTLRRITKKIGHQAGTLEKVLWRLNLFQKIACDQILFESLVLKRDMALNVVDVGRHRFSADIDLNYVGALDRTTMKSERPSVDAALNPLLHPQPITNFKQDYVTQYGSNRDKIYLLGNGVCPSVMGAIVRQIGSE